MPKPNKSCSCFDASVYINAWTAAVMTGEDKIATDLEELVGFFNEIHEKNYDNAVARRENKSLPYDSVGVGNGIMMIPGLIEDLNNLISDSYKKLEAKTAEKKKSQ